MEDLNNRICLYCNKTLRKIGRDRKIAINTFMTGKRENTIENVSI